MLRAIILLLDPALLKIGACLALISEEPPRPAAAEFWAASAKIPVIPDPRPRYCESSAPQSLVYYPDGFDSSAKS